jgi:hypothetical protein
LNLFGVICSHGKIQKQNVLFVLNNNKFVTNTTFYLTLYTFSFEINESRLSHFVYDVTLFFPFIHQRQVTVLCLTFQWYDVISKYFGRERLVQRRAILLSPQCGDTTSCIIRLKYNLKVEFIWCYLFAREDTKTKCVICFE